MLCLKTRLLSGFAEHSRLEKEMFKKLTLCCELNFIPNEKPSFEKIIWEGFLYVGPEGQFRMI
jgi:hypothetical protein